MRVLLVAHYFWPHVGGMEAVVAKQAQSLIDRGHSVTILTCRPAHEVAPLEQRDGYSIQRIPAVNFIERVFGVTFPIIGPWEFLRFLKAVRSHDIVHIHDVFYMSSQLAAVACIASKKDFFLTQHVAMVDHPSTLVIMVQRIMYATWGRLLFQRAKKIVTYNQTVRRFVATHGAGEGTLLTHYNGIDTTYFQPVNNQKKRTLRRRYHLPVDRPIVLFVGRLVPKKGYDIVYDAQSSKYFTLIVGEGLYPDRMTSNDNVRLFGAATTDELGDLYAICDVFAFPAIGEIFTLVMQEAMASGLPVVTTDDPGYAPYDFSRQHVQLVARDSNAFRNVLEHIIGDASQRKSMQVYSRNFAVDNFDWRRNYEQEYAIYGTING